MNLIELMEPNTYACDHYSRNNNSNNEMLTAIEPIKVTQIEHHRTLPNNYDISIEPIPLFTQTSLNQLPCQEEQSFCMPSVTARKISKQVDASMIMMANNHRERFASYDDHSSNGFPQCLPRVPLSATNISTKRVAIELDSTMVGNNHSGDVNLKAAAAAARAAAAAAQQHKQQQVINQKSSSSKSTVPVKFPRTYSLSPFDIMCGRHKKALHHEGNRKFRALISKFLPRYFQYSGRVDRAILALDIMEAVAKSGGYFLKQNRETGEWVELSDKEKRNKVGHALRDASNFSQGTTFKTALQKQNEKKQQRQEQEQQLLQQTEASIRKAISNTTSVSQQDELSDEELSTILGDDNDTTPLFTMLNAATVLEQRQQQRQRHHEPQQLQQQQQQQQQPIPFVNTSSNTTLLEDLSDFEF